MSSRKFATLSADLLDRSGARAAVEAEAAFNAYATPALVTWHDESAALEPRALTNRQAAAYVGVSPKTFVKLVDKGLFAKPMELAEQRRWDRYALDRTMDRLSGLARAN